MKLPHLAIDSVNLQAGSSTSQIGKIKLTDVNVHTHYDSKDHEQPVQASLDFANLDVSDILLSNSASMTAISQLQINGLRMAAGATDSVKRDAVPGPGGLSGGLPILFPVLLLIPLLALLAAPLYLIAKIVGAASKGIDDNKQKGMAADFSELTKSINFSVSSVNVHGFTTSGGQHVDSIDVKDITIAAGMNSATNLRAKKQSLEHRLEKLGDSPGSAAQASKLRDALKEVNDKMAQAEHDEEEHRQLRAEIAKGNLSDARGRAEMYVDIGSVDISGVRGTITANEPLHFGAIHGEGGSTALAQILGNQVETPQRTNANAAAGQRSAPLAEQRDLGDFELDLHDVKTGKVVVEGGIRTEADIQEEIDALKNSKDGPEYPSQIADLEALLPKARRYAIMQQKGLSHLSENKIENDKLLLEYMQLRTELTAKPALIIASARAKDAKFTADASIHIGFKASEFEMTGIELPKQGKRIERLYAQDLDIRANIGTNLANFTQWRKYLQDGDLNATTIRLEDYQDVKGGKAAKLIAINRLKAHADFGADGKRNASAHITAGAVEDGKDVPAIEISGVNLRLSVAILKRQLAQIQDIKVEDLPAAKRQLFIKRRQELTAMLKTLEVLTKAVEVDAQALDKASEAKKPAIYRRLVRDQAALEEWEKTIAVKRLTVSGLDLNIDQLGDILASDHDVSKHGFHVVGGGKDQ
ncbi:MAG: hypothetical protein HYZ45_00515, partial [Burkholderiales bacterium]|nr:hypothetical protein [Burkholderiales bacterium]